LFIMPLTRSGVQIPARKWQDRGMNDGPPETRPQKPVRRLALPLDEAALRTLALGYAARFATTRARLARYLERKLKERGWDGAQPADIGALTDRLAELGYIDDAAFAAMKGRAMAARGLGQRRVSEALAAAGVAAQDRGDAPGQAAMFATAVAFARRKRLGPYARSGTDDPKQREKALAAMLRAGHRMDVARRVLAAETVAAAEALISDEAC
jgi:regulatory protein